MKISATSGPISSLYFSIGLLMVLASVSNKAHAMPRGERNIGRRDSEYRRVKGRCHSYGHPCLSAYGKRYDSTVRRDTLQESISRDFQEFEIPTSPKDELFYILPNNEFREPSDQSFMRTLKSTQQLHSNPLSSLVNQLITSHRHSRRSDPNITKYK